MCLRVWYLTPFSHSLLHWSEPNRMGDQKRKASGNWVNGSEGKILIFLGCCWREWLRRDRKRLIPIPISNQYPHNEIHCYAFYIPDNSLFIRTKAQSRSRSSAPCLWLHHDGHFSSLALGAEFIRGRVWIELFLYKIQNTDGPWLYIRFSSHFLSLSHLSS